MSLRRASRIVTILALVLAAAMTAASATAAQKHVGARAAKGIAAALSSAIAIHHVRGCGESMLVFTPANPRGEFRPGDLGLPDGPGSLLAEAAQRHVQWLPTLTCRTHPADPVPRLGHPKKPVRISANYYLNWAGYVDSTTSPDYIQADWPVPQVCCDKSGPDLSSFWPGIGDGSKKGTELIQDGTEQNVSTSGATTYYFWFELFPKEAQEEVTNLVPKAGQSVGVSASWGVSAKGQAEFVICDFTKSKCVIGAQSSPAPDNRAEWIAERTAYCKSGDYWFPALASFSVAEFSAGYYDLNAEQKPEFPISHGSPVKSYMVDINGDRLATPGSLGSGGTAFNVIWDDYGTPSEIQPAQPC